MNRTGKYLKFWGVNLLENLGISMGGGLVMLLFVGAGYTEFSDTTIVDTAETLLGLFPYYVVMAALFANCMISISYFQTYFSVLVSLNATRKSVFLGIQLGLLGTIAAVLIVSAAVWSLVPGEISGDGLRVMPLLAGGLLMGTGVMEALGAVISRWGKIGVLLLVAVLLGLGFGAGIYCSLSGEGLTGLQSMNVLNMGLVLGAGAMVYLLCALFALAVTRKLEVQI